MSGDQPGIGRDDAIAPPAEEIAAAPAVTPDAAPTAVRALVEVTERHGNVVTRHLVTRWPVRIGRALDSDIVLDDAHVAPRHLVLDQLAPGQVRVQVQDTVNGVALGRKTHGRATSFDWQPGQVLSLGRQHLRLRLAETALAPEQELPGGSQHGVMLTLVAVAAMLIQMVAQLWLRGTGADGNWQEVPQILVGGLGALFIWAGLWAMVSRVISHHAQFWRHVRIACAVLVVAFIAEFVLQALAFAFSLEMLARFTNLALVLFAAYGIYRHLLVAAPVTPEQFLKEAATLEQRVQARLKAGEDEGDAEPEEDEE